MRALKQPERMLENIAQRIQAGMGAHGPGHAASSARHQAPVSYTHLTDRLTIVNALLAEMNYRSLYMDLDGTVRARPWTAPSLQGVQHVYESGKDSVLLPSLSLGRDTFDLPNVFIREVENPDLDKTLRAVAENKDADSPISIQNRGFRVVDYEKVDNVASQEELNGMVQNLLVQSRFSNETVSYETGPQPTHGIWDVVLLRHGEDKGIYEETAWELTLDHKMCIRDSSRRLCAAWRPPRGRISIPFCWPGPWPA